MPSWTVIVIGLIALLIGSAAGFFAGYKSKVKNSEGKVYDAEEEAKKTDE